MKTLPYPLVMFTNFRTLVFIGLLLLLNSCKKDPDIKEDIPSGPITVDEARAYFEQEILPKKSNSPETSTERSVQRSLIKYAEWEKAYIKQISTGEAIVVPIKYDGTAFITTDPKLKQGLSLDKISYLMIYKGQNKKMNAEWVTYLPGPEWIAGNRDRFMGKVIINDWMGNNLKAYVYHQDGRIDSITKRNFRKNGASVKLEPMVCLEFTYSKCVAWAENSPSGKNQNTVSIVTRKCTDWSVDISTECFYVEDSGSGGTGPGGSEGGGASGGGGTAPGDYPPGDCDPSPTPGISKNAAGVKKLPPCDDYEPGPLPVAGPPGYVLSDEDYAILNLVVQEDNAADAAINSPSACYGTGRNGNVKWPGTPEHWLIQYDYVATHAGSFREYSIPGSSSALTGNRGYADLVNTMTNEIFEIKPDNDYGRTHGSLEAQFYLDKALQSCPTINGAPWVKGTNYQNRYLPHPTDPSQVLESELNSAGVIVYGPVPKINNPQPIPVLLPQNLADKLKDFVQQLLLDQSNMQVKIITFLRQNPQIVPYLKAVAAGIVIGTIIEDILTGGVGVADDWASFVIARNIYRIATKI